MESMRHTFPPLFTNLYFLLCVFGGFSIVHGQSELPRCPKSGYFDQCFGSSKSSDGETYTGEFRKGVYDGNGTLILGNGEKYVGEFRNGKQDGRGVYTFPDGRKIVGGFLNGEWDGWMELTLGDGLRFEGNFSKGKRKGYGSFYYVKGSGSRLVKVSGEFDGDELNGRCSWVWTTGQKYDGECKRGKFNGKGVFTWFNGWKTLGVWADNVLVEEASESVSGADIENGTVKLSCKDNLCSAPLKINGKLTLNFVVDSSAVNVSIPAQLVPSLGFLGVVERSDTKVEKLASPSGRPLGEKRTIHLKTLSLGGVTINDVEVLVTSTKASLVLGQSFLSRLRSFSIDNSTMDLRVVK